MSCGAAPLIVVSLFATYASNTEQHENVYTRVSASIAHEDFLYGAPACRYAVCDVELRRELKRRRS